VPDGLLGAEEGAAQVDRQHLVEGVGGQVLGVGGDLDAGVVDQVVEPSVLLEDAVEHLGDLVLVRDVGADQDGAGAALAQLLHADVDAVLDGFLGLLGPLGRSHVVDGHVDAFLAEADGDGLADAGAAAGDDGDLALQSLHGVLLVAACRVVTAAPRPVTAGSAHPGPRPRSARWTRWGSSGG
jgi:hypothetical protein